MVNYQTIYTRNIQSFSQLKSTIYKLNSLITTPSYSKTAGSKGLVTQTRTIKTPIKQRMVFVVVIIIYYMTYHYPLLQHKNSISPIVTLLGGQGWIQHLIDTVRSNKGKIFKHLIVDKYMNELDKVSGGFLIKAILKPYLDNLAFQHDYVTQKQIRLRRQKENEKYKGDVKKQEAQLNKDFRVQQQKATGKTVNLRRDPKHALQVMADVNKKILEQQEAKKQEAKKQEAQKQGKTQEQIDKEGLKIAQQLLDKIKTSTK